MKVKNENTSLESRNGIWDRAYEVQDLNVYATIKILGANEIAPMGVVYCEEKRSECRGLLTLPLKR